MRAPWITRAASLAGLIIALQMHGASGAGVIVPEGKTNIVSTVKVKIAATNLVFASESFDPELPDETIEVGFDIDSNKVLGINVPVPDRENPLSVRLQNCVITTHRSDGSPVTVEVDSICRQFDADVVLRCPDGEKIVPMLRVTSMVRVMGRKLLRGNDGQVHVIPLLGALAGPDAEVLVPIEPALQEPAMNRWRMDHNHWSPGDRIK